MNEILLTLIAILLFALMAVLAYNMLQENHYRNKIRNQFGHSDRDALMGSQVQSVRDGHNVTHEYVSPTDIHTSGQYEPQKREPKRLKPSLVGKKNVPPEEPEEIAPETLTTHQSDNVVSEPVHSPSSYVAPETEYPQYDPPHQTVSPPVVQDPAPPVVPQQVEPTGGTSLVGEIKATFARMLGGNEPPPFVPDQAQDKAIAVSVPTELDEPQRPPEPPKPLLIPLEDLKLSRLPWFDPRVDYMAYVSLREGTELLALPRLSNRYRFQIVGCTMDGLFQIAEPIPGVQYQAFAIGLQAISRNGLANERELQLFGQQVDMLAESMNGEAFIEDIDHFLNIARPLDELCAQVDQTIAIHLVSRVSILGIELRSTLEELGFQLLEDGTFGFSDVGGDIKYTVVTLDGSRFTSSLLSSQPYKGFSMLFDITRVPHGEHNFDEFMNLAVRLSSVLNLELVDDQIQQLSPEWLKEVRTYVLHTQKEMLEADIMPGGNLAQRLFA